MLRILTFARCLGRTHWDHQKTYWYAPRKQNSGVDGTHRCFVFKPLTIDLVATREIIDFDEAVFKTVAFHILRALEFLHTKAQMVHGSASLFIMTFSSFLTVK